MPECSDQVGSLYAAAKQRQLVDSCNSALPFHALLLCNHCRFTLFLSSVETFNSLLATLNPISATGGQQVGACVGLLSSTPKLDNQLIDCIAGNLDPRLIAEFYSYWGRTPSGNFTQDLTDQYTIQGCIQAGSKPFDTANQKVPNFPSFYSNQYVCRF